MWDASRRRPWLLAVLLALGAGTAVAQVTSGRIAGVIRDEQGVPLAGARITVESPALLGRQRSSVANAGGTFQFIGLNPGTYVVQAELEGYASRVVREVKVWLGGVAWLSMTMPRARFEDQIEVVDRTPVVDPRQVNTEQLFDSSYLARATVGSRNRSYRAVLDHAPGVVGSSNPRVLGSTISENAYFIDGQDTTDPVTSTWGSEFNFDSVAEVELQTSGFEAEYGRATGGLVNLVTRSGGNRFSGSLDLRFSDDSFQESGEHFDAADLQTSMVDASATLGGPLLRDRAWFFAAYERSRIETTPVGSPTTRTRQASNFNGKLSWQPSDGWRLVARAAGAPVEIANANASRFVSREAAALQDQSTDLAALEIGSLVTDSLFWNLVAGLSRSRIDLVPASGNLEQAAHFDYSTGVLHDNFNLQQYTERRRSDLATDLSWFFRLAGSHEVKLGLQAARTGLDVASCATGTADGPCPAGGTGHVYFDFGYRVPYFLVESITAGAQDYEGRLSTVFLQDAWQVGSGVTLKAGVRWDDVVYHNNAGARVAHMDRVQPRVGVAWDVGGDAKSVLRASWGRFMDPSSLVLPSVLRARDETTARWAACSTLGSYAFGVEGREECAAVAASLGWGFRTWDPDGIEPWGWLLPPSEVRGTGGTRVLGGLDAAYADTLSVSFEREIWRRSAVEVSVIDKRTRDLFEDTCEGNIPVPSEDAACGAFVLANLPGLARDYRALMLRFETRAVDWLTLLASYTLSSSRGNLDYSQGENYDFDVYPYHWVNRSGYLGDHRRHRIKINGFASLGRDWTLAVDGWWSSRFTWQPQADPGDDPRIPGGFMFLEPRGSRGGFSASQLDLQLSKGFAVAGGRLVVIGTVFNALGSEHGTVVCSDVGGCGTFAMGEAVDWAAPRSYEVGARFEF